MHKSKFIITFLSCTAFQPAFCHTPVAGNVHATIGPYLYETLTNSVVPQRESPYLLGSGLIANGDVDQNGGVEIAMIYLNKLYFRQLGNRALAEKIKRMYITTGYRHWFVPALSFGGSFFSSYSMGDASVVREDNSDTTDQTTARQITEYGLDFSAQWEFWQNDDMGLLIDSRYSVSLTHKSHEQANVFGMLVGIKYLIPKPKVKK